MPTQAVAPQRPQPGRTRAGASTPLPSWLAVDHSRDVSSDSQGVVADDRASWLVAAHDRLLVREALELTPAERLDSLRVADSFFNGARRVER